MSKLDLTQEELEAIVDALDIAYADEPGSRSDLVDALRLKLDEYANPIPGKGLRDLIRDHQEATDCSDDTMVHILCDFLVQLDDAGHLPSDLDPIDYVVERLERGPE